MECLGALGGVRGFGFGLAGTASWPVAGADSGEGETKSGAVLVVAGNVVVLSVGD